MKENWENNWKDYYKILQVHPSAEPEVIKGAYDKLARKYHPDINQNPTSSQRMKDINEAFEILSNPEKNKRYYEAYSKRIGSVVDNPPSTPISKPKPEVLPRILRFQGIKRGEIRKETFIIKNTGGPFSKVLLSNPSSWIKIVRQTQLSSLNKLPLSVEIEVIGEEWGKSYVDNIIVKLDDIETHVRVELQTQAEPLNEPTAVPQPIIKRQAGFPVWRLSLTLIGVILVSLLIWRLAYPQPDKGIPNQPVASSLVEPTTLALPTTTSVPFKPTTNQIVTFPDPNLQATIRSAINKPTGDIYSSDLLKLTLLDATKRNISSLDGLEYCMNLTNLSLSSNKITKISPLTSLTNLTKLYLSNNQINDISPLASLNKLTMLGLDTNQISNISPLASLTELTQISLAGNQITSIPPLASLTKLTSLQLQVNQIVNISQFAFPKSLKGLELHSNKINDISSMTNLPEIISISLNGNQVRDISPLLANSGLSAGDLVDLRNNPLNGISVNTQISQLLSRGVTVNYP